MKDQDVLCFKRIGKLYFTGDISSYLTHHYAINVYCYDPDMNKSTFLYRIPL